jgi:hypothetical protein
MKQARTPLARTTKSAPVQYKPQLLVITTSMLLVIYRHTSMLVAIPINLL